MPIERGLTLLRDRYRLIDQRIEISANSESWVGITNDNRKVLITLWPYTGSEPPELLRALWDAELRTLYRVASAPGADQSILVIRDAGLDRIANCFVMVLEAEGSAGYERLSTALQARSTYSWLQLDDIAARRNLWRALGRVGAGIAQLHDQNTLHRNIEAERVYFSAETDVESFRLGGFEWSVRLGLPGTKPPPAGWSSPPEFFKERYFGYRPETDWYGFGMLAARCFRSLETYQRTAPVQRHQAVVQQLEKASAQELSDLEKSTILRLVADDPYERLCDGKTIENAINDIVTALEAKAHSSRDMNSPLVLAINTSNVDLANHAREMGFLPNPNDKNEMFNPRDALHVSRLASYVQDDLDRADPCIRISSVKNRQFYVLEGESLVLRLTAFNYTDRARNESKTTWNIGYCSGVAEFRNTEASIEFSSPRIRVKTVAEVYKKNLTKGSRDWERYLPRTDPTSVLKKDLSRFYNYIRCTNQIELLLLDAEIFSYELVGDATVRESRVQIVLKEIDRDRPAIDMFEIDGGLIEFLQRQFLSRGITGKQVVLTDHDSLIFDQRERRANTWTIDAIDLENQRVLLTQVADTEFVRQPSRTGYIRSFGMFGQVPLIQRRKKAIDRLEKHSFLLRSLSAPGQVYMDTGLAPLPVPPPIGQVDSTKRAALEDILRVRPIYTLQGPPGTGKTTLVAHLLRQIFEEDPVAQVLITAQAHGAVDVLRSKVRDEAFMSVSAERMPLSVRIGMDDGDDEEHEVEGSVRQVALELLQQSRRQLAQTESRSELQDAWLVAVVAMLDETGARNASFRLDDFLQTVKRGASITYCTTSAGDLEALADSIQSFDWTIVEEAGKAYAFDLALPLQMGHRWLLIGDHNQLPPYRFEDHKEAVSRLDEIARALQALPGLNYKTLDSEWLRWWTELEEADREDFKEYVESWLNGFKQFYSCCSRSSGEARLTMAESVGAAAGKLTEQHRMHPAIGDLISTVFYDGELINRTEEDGRPIPRVTHPLVVPAGIEGKAIVWLNTEWSAKNKPEFAEKGRLQGATPYTNEMEVDALFNFVSDLRANDEWLLTSPGQSLELVALTPYVQQVALINSRFDETVLPSYLKLIRSAFRDVDADGKVFYKGQLAHTVDSFQGNQADIVCASLVRNNDRPPGEGLGFMKDRPRLNVLLSRAKRVLVLIGSWEFYEHQLSKVEDDLDPLWHWRMVMNIIKSEDGRRAKIIPARYSLGGVDVVAPPHQ